MRKFAFSFSTTIVLVFIAGILSPLFGATPEDRPKDISITLATTEAPRLDTACKETYRLHERGIASTTCRDTQ